MKHKLIQKTATSINLSKTLVYSIEYRMLYMLAQTFSSFVQPPKRQTQKELINNLRKEVVKIHEIDGENIAKGIYPMDVLRPKGLKDHILNFPQILADSLLVSRRRKVNSKHEVDIPVDTPDYLNRNYHFQTGGYFSDKSARFYEHQVEILFSGTAAPMRRILIEKIKKRELSDKPLRILEVGAGVGTATFDYAKSLNHSEYVVSDISEPYLERAKGRLKGNFQFVKCKAEELPFQEGEFDLVVSVYLFHELPRSVRDKVIMEAFRVLKPKGIFAICDSIQRDDDPSLNQVLADFPVDYHEPFYKDYTLWSCENSLTSAGFENVESSYQLLSKYWTSVKPTH